MFSTAWGWLNYSRYILKGVGAAQKNNSTETLRSVTFLTLINSVQGSRAYRACIIKLKAEIYTPVPKERL